MAHDVDQPSDDALGRWLWPFFEGSSSRIVLAVSGGPDSTALMHAAAQAGGTSRLIVATVHHGLRPESAEEAAKVAASAAALGLSHETLTWADTKPATGIAAAARTARYRLLGNHARSIGADLVLTGHTRDDQAETVLMRLLAGSGPTGLAGMRRERELEPGIRLGRPFLSVPKAELVAYCERHGLDYLRDPSNHDDRYGRARLRRVMPLLAADGLSAERLCRLAERSARDDDALAAAAQETLQETVRSGIRGLTLDGQALAALPRALLIRVVAAALERAGAGGAIRLERLERLILGELLPALQARTPLRRTLAGILIVVGRSGEVTLAAAPARRSAVERPAPPQAGTLAAGAPDLLGKGDGAAYIGPACQD